MFELELSNELGDLGIGIMFASGTLVIAVAAALFFTSERAKLLAGILYLFGLVVLWLSLLLSLGQTIKISTPSMGKKYPDVITFEPRHDLQFCYLVYISLVIIPLIGGRGFFLGREISRRRLTDTYAAHLKTGLDLFRQRKYEAAIAEFSHALQVNPGHAEPYFRRARAYLQQGNLDLALSDLNRTLALEPQHSDAYIHRAEVHVARGFSDLALVDFDTSLNLQPNFPEGYLHRGFCRVENGNTLGAIADFRKVIQLTNLADLTGPARSHLQQLGASERV